MEPNRGKQRHDPRPGRTERDREALEARRGRAAQMFRGGEKQADVARAGVSAQSVSRWYRDWRRGGVRSLRRATRAGRPPQLTPAQLHKVERALLKGPRAHGYATDLWTLGRIGEVIRRQTGVGYHQGHVWKILRSLGWSLQRPAKKPRERDDEQLNRWRRERWPKVKKTPADEGRGWSSRTSRGSR